MTEPAPVHPPPPRLVHAIENWLERVWPHEEELELEHFLARFPELCADLAELGAELGPYALLRVLGQGGMGTVFLCHERGLDRRLALKILRSIRAGQPGRAEALQREAALGGRLDHPGVLPVHDRGTTSDGRPFFVMAPVRGRSLDVWVAELFSNPDRHGTAEELHQLISTVARVAEAVAAAHRRGVVHLDLKPSNVMLGEFGEVYLIDFGLARPSGKEDPGPVMVRGTPSYIAPERVSQPDAPPAPATDVYGLGTILFEVLSGHPPFRPTAGESLAKMLARVSTEAAPSIRAHCRPGWEDARLATLVDACLASSPSERPQDAGDVARELAGWLEQGTAPAVVEQRRARAEAALDRAMMGLAELEQTLREGPPAVPDDAPPEQRAVLWIWEDACTAHRDSVQGELLRARKELIELLAEERDNLDGREGLAHCAFLETRLLRLQGGATQELVCSALEDAGRELAPLTPSSRFPGEAPS